MAKICALLEKWSLFETFQSYCWTNCPASWISMKHAQQVSLCWSNISPCLMVCVCERHLMTFRLRLSYQVTIPMHLSHEAGQTVTSKTALPEHVQSGSTAWICLACLQHQKVAPFKAYWFLMVICREGLSLHIATSDKRRCMRMLNLSALGYYGWACKGSARPGRNWQCTGETFLAAWKPILVRHHSNGYSVLQFLVNWQSQTLLRVWDLFEPIGTHNAF